MASDMTKQSRKIVSIAIALSMMLGACRVSDSSNNNSVTTNSQARKSKAVLTASDIEVTVECEAWMPSVAGQGQADCDVIIDNFSAASGVIWVSWTWLDGDKYCGIGVQPDIDGVPSNLIIDSYENVVLSGNYTNMCAPTWYRPEAEQIEVQIRG
jgi:hypothetical protein